MYQPYPSSGQPVEPLRPPAPAPVLTAVKLMYAGAAVSAVNLIIGLAFIIVDNTAGTQVITGHSLTAPARLRPLIITVGIVFGLVVIALWLWMARANGQGRNWARIVSTVLFGLATLQLSPATCRAGGHAGFAGGAVLGVTARRRGLVAGLPRCGCCGARPPPRSSSRRASPRPGTAHSRLPGLDRPAHSCRVGCEPC